jgi:hypothetical protein
VPHEFIPENTVVNKDTLVCQQKSVCLGYPKIWVINDLSAPE